MLSKMKVLLLGDASNYHNTLAVGLRRHGVDVTVASAGSGFQRTGRDIDLRRPLPGKAGGLALWLKLNTSLRSKLSGYDVVSIHSPNFLDLRPEKIRKVFERLRRENGKVFLTALGTDVPYIEEALDPDSVLRYNEMRLLGKPGPHAVAHPEIIPAYTSGVLREWQEAVYENIDGAVAALYEYYLSCLRRLPPEKVGYAGIPIDLQAFKPVEIPQDPSPVRIFLGRHHTRQDIKGTDRLEIAIRRAIERHPDRGQLVIVEDRPYAEYIQLLKGSHVIVDQAYSYSPATNALLAMAYGIPAVSGAEPLYYDFIGQAATAGVRQELVGPGGVGYTPGEFDPQRPIFNSPIDIEGMTDLFSSILSDPTTLHLRGLASRAFVEKHHAAELVAARFLTFWRSHQ